MRFWACSLTQVHIRSQAFLEEHDAQSNNLSHRGRSSGRVTNNVSDRCKCGLGSDRAAASISAVSRSSKPNTRGFESLLY